MAISFVDLEDGESVGLGDELNARFNALKDGVNLAYQFRGAWDSVTTYDAQDGVTIAGQFWVSLQDSNLNNSPAENAYWTLAAAKGSTGATGATGGAGATGAAGPTGPQGIAGGSLDWKGDWANATAYVVDDAVQSGTRKSSYRCKADHTSDATTQPGSGASWSTYWTLFAQSGDTGAAGATGATGAAGTAGADGTNGSDGADGDDGLNGVVWQGAWDDTTGYVANDAVEDNGTSYVCTAPTTNNQPPNASYWDVLAARGDTGATGLAGGSMNWLGDWATSTAYAADDAVQNDDPKSSYRCQTAHTSDSTTEPGVGVNWATKWTLFAEAGAAGADGADGAAGSGINAETLQGRALAATAPEDNQAMVWDEAGAMWKPGTVAGGGSGGSVDAATVQRAIWLYA